MAWLPRSPALLIAVVLLGAGLPMLDPSPPAAKANAGCDVAGAISPAGVVGAISGFGNPLSDVCDAVTSEVIGVATDKLKEAASAIGEGVFNKVTAWVAEGAVWLIGEVAVLSDKTTKPNLLSKGFLKQYRLMALIAASMAALMLILAVFEALGRGEAGMLWRVFVVNAPLAAIATSAAYVVVQLLVATCDGMGEAISQSTGADAEKFFQGAVKATVTVGGGAGASGGAAVGGAAGAAAGAVAVPLFVGFIAICVLAFAAFFVWLELLMRDAAIYVVALFMPLALAASIWPRWVSALKRTCELLVVIVFSKFVIVAIIALAASLLAHSEESVEHVLAAAAMLLLACFAPFVLLKLVPFAESALSSAYGRQSAPSSAVRTVELTNSMLMVQRLSRANWAGASSGEGGGAAAGGGKGAGGGGPKGGSGGGGGGASEAAGAAGAGVAVVGAGAKAAKEAQAGGQRLAGTGGAEAASGASSGDSSASGSSSAAGAQSAPRPRAAEGASTPGASDLASPAPGRSGAEPAELSEAHGGTPPTSGAKPPRPAAEKGTTGGAGGAR